MLRLGPQPVALLEDGGIFLGVSTWWKKVRPWRMSSLGHYQGGSFRYFLFALQYNVVSGVIPPHGPFHSALCCHRRQNNTNQPWSEITEPRWRNTFLKLISWGVWSQWQNTNTFEDTGVPTIHPHKHLCCSVSWVMARQFHMRRQPLLTRVSRRGRDG